jgi:hypothetical protein
MSDRKQDVLSAVFMDILILPDKPRESNLEQSKTSPIHVFAN